jgi:hypothetical protein
MGFTALHQGPVEAVSRAAVDHKSPASISWLLAACLVVIPGICRPEILAQAWWIVILALWLFPRPPSPRLDNARPLAVVIAAVKVGVLGWLFYEIQSGLSSLLMQYESTAWDWRGPLSPIIPVTIASVATVILIAPPFVRLIGERELLAAGVIAAPHVVTNAAQAIGRWASHPASHVAYLYIGLAPTALLMAMALAVSFYRPKFRSRWMPHGDPIDHAWWSLYSRDSPAASASVYGLLLALTIFLIWARVNHAPPSSGSLDVSIFWTGTIAGLELLLLPTGIYCWRSLARFKQRGSLAANVGAGGQFLLGASFLLLVPWGVLIEAPYATSLLKDAMRLFNARPCQVAAASPTVLRIKGEFTDGTGEAVERAIEQHPALRLVVLDGPGGNLFEGIRIASAIRAHHLSTVTFSECSSACTLAFSAGGERILERGARLGFHRCTDGIWLDDCDRGTAAGARLLIANGIDKDFVAKAFHVPNSEVWYPSVLELQAARVITATELKPRNQLTSAEAKFREDALAGRVR